MVLLNPQVRLGMDSPSPQGGGGGGGTQQGAAQYGNEWAKEGIGPIIVTGDGAVDQSGYGTSTGNTTSGAPQYTPEDTQHMGAGPGYSTPSYYVAVQPGGFCGPGGDMYAPANQNPGSIPGPINAAGNVAQSTSSGTPSPAPGVGERIVGTVMLAGASMLCEFAGCGVANAVAPGEAGVPQMSEGEKVLRSGLAAASAAGLGVVARILGGAARGAGATSRVLGFTERNLQKGFTKHGADFGLTGNWNPSRAADFSRAVNQHINDPLVEAIEGTYRGAPAMHYFNPATGVNVIADPAGNFVGGWRLGAEQMENLMRTGELQ